MAMKLATFVLSALFASRALGDNVVGPFPQGVPGSGYGCDNPCTGGPNDVNYVITASLHTYTIPGSRNAQNMNGNGVNDFKMVTRSFVGDKSLSSPFCQGDDDGSSGPNGPCLQVNPGQNLYIKIVNNMTNVQALLDQTGVSFRDFLDLAQIQGGTVFLGPIPTDPNDLIETNPENYNGNEVSYDDVNLHVHGLNVIPHLYYPMGTDNKFSEMITIVPPNENQPGEDHSCFCYNFSVPSDHPQGTYWWHMHRHGSSLISAWAGLFGFLYVGTDTNPKSPVAELAAQNITRTEPVVIWEWQFNKSSTFNNDPLSIKEANYRPVDNPNITILVNNAYQPTLTACQKETIHIRLLCGQSFSGSALYFMDEANDTIPFYIFASDGISYASTYKKTMIIVGPAQREGVLVQFPTPGQYRLMRGDVPRLNGITIQSQPQDPIIFFNVGTCTGDGKNLSALTFTPGLPVGSVTNPEIIDDVSVAFSTVLMGDRAPVAQFLINNQAYDGEEIDTLLTTNTAQQWKLVSTVDEWHPFHIHVNPFEVLSVFTPSVPGSLPGGVIVDAVTNFGPSPTWRDTVYIPPNGIVVIRHQFGHEIAFAGKTVYHCHFLEHEDAGMMSTMLIAKPGTTVCSALSTTCVKNSDCCGYDKKAKNVTCAANSANENVCTKCSEKGGKCNNKVLCCNAKAECVKAKGAKKKTCTK